MSTPVLTEHDVNPPPQATAKTRGRLMLVTVEVVIGRKASNVKVLNLSGETVGTESIDTAGPDGKHKPAEQLAREIASKIEQIVIIELHLKERNKPVQAISITLYDTSADGPWPPDSARSAINIIRTKLWDICSCNHQPPGPRVTLVSYPTASSIPLPTRSTKEN